MSKKVGKIVTKEMVRAHLAKMGADSLFIKPSENFIKAINQSGSHGSCRHFNWEAGQQAMKEQRFVERMLLEERYRAEWFENWQMYGFCDLWEGRLILANVPALCMRWDLDSSLVNKPEGQKTVPCPHYEERSGKGDKLIISRSAKRSLTY